MDTPHIDNNILTKAAGRAAVVLRLSLAQEGMSMSTYEELQIIISIALLIIAILTYTHRK